MSTPRGPARVLFLSSCVRGGGAGRSLETLLADLDRERIDPLVVVPDRGIYADRFRELGLDPVVVRGLTESTTAPRGGRARPFADYLANAASSLRSAGALRRLIEERGIELVHCNNMLVKTPGALAAVLAGVGCSFHARNIHRGAAAGYYGTLARLPVVRGVIANSEATALPYRRRTPAKVTVVHNGVDLRRFDPGSIPAGTLARRLGIGEQAPLIGFTGHLIERKGVDLLLRAAALAAARVAELRVVIAGREQVGDTPGQEAALRRLAAELGIADRTHFVGFTDDVRPLLVDLRAAVVPSRQEPFGRAVIEPMALGIPVVAARVGGIPEIVTDGVDGLLVEPGNIDELAAAIVRVLADPEHAADIGAAARRTVRERFDGRAAARRIEDCLHRFARPGGTSANAG